MPEAVTTFPTKHRGRPPKYDWDQLVDAGPMRFVQGQDFDTTPANFRSLAHYSARVRGLKAETVIQNNAVLVQFLER